jgi:hypothetical protein
MRLPAIQALQAFHGFFYGLNDLIGKETLV